jgi:hypothetical protein
MGDTKETKQQKDLELSRIYNIITNLGIIINSIYFYFFKVESELKKETKESPAQSEWTQLLALIIIIIKKGMNEGREREKGKVIVLLKPKHYMHTFLIKCKT